jgi:acyl dehydratase
MADETDKLHWEDIEIGKPVTYGRYEVTKDEIFEFAAAYDPQAHHLDEEVAKHGPTKGLCASGWHTCAMFMRLLCDGLLKNSTSLGAAGIEETKWLKPVRPGDVLSARSTCTEKRALRSRPGVGTARWSHEVLNQNGEVVMLSANAQFIRIRHPEKVSAEGGRS